MIEIRFHAWDRQGVETSVELLALAAMAEGKYVQAFTNQPLQKGAPVKAFVRVNEVPISLAAQIEEPDVAVVLDESLLTVQDVTQGLKKTGILILNTAKAPEEIREIYGYQVTLGVINGNQIAREILGTSMVNTIMLGAVIKVTQIVHLESIEPPMLEHLGRSAPKNLAALQKAYKETVIQERET
ncbi:MAG: 2-oxoacid:acceptor oxidoreductase family protein [Deltaproteobacteria bacterium]|nr:2-oxoacid:acceptor oxidoreductase family protein [Deltaproteobacteria bacterium]MBW1953598.1 2-oxoacid:acceptor oxidoreductase family protein [Deltaproteobacteria bacterium]MBW1986760.1 2-oxoacid:acceptor oxidoreductase family protein [Deltaproteobacteria bacterium]MBW2135264.1 2-oxoacid:acceptor oxidoreductase family protein [Deltaproteobacteria bacterium]